MSEEIRTVSTVGEALAILNAEETEHERTAMETLQTAVRKQAAEIATLRARLAEAEKKSQAARDVIAERERQIAAEGWTPDHDDRHSQGEMALAAAAYAANAATRTRPLADVTLEFPGGHLKKWFPVMAYDILWPFQRVWWKPKDPRRDLVRAGALIIAEIERLDRAAPQPSGNEPQEASQWCSLCDRKVFAKDIAECRHICGCIFAQPSGKGKE